MSRISWPKSRFLPTPSARRATEGHDSTFVLPQISTHALREEGDGVHAHPQDRPHLISTHALREEGDGKNLPRAIR